MINREIFAYHCDYLEESWPPKWLAMDRVRLFWEEGACRAGRWVSALRMQRYFGGSCRTNAVTRMEMVSESHNVGKTTMEYRI